MTEIKFSNIKITLDSGFVFKELSPDEVAEIEDKVSAKIGSDRGKRFELHTAKEFFVKSCVAFPKELVESESFGGDFICNEDNLKALFEYQTLFCSIQVKAAMHKITNQRLEELKNSASGLFSGGKERKERG